MALAFGECIVSSRYNPDGSLAGIHVDRADRRILASPELLAAIEENKTDWPASYHDGILKIFGDNQTVIYRLTGRILNGDNWRDPCIVMEWPD